MGQRLSSFFREGLRDALHTFWLWFFNVIGYEHTRLLANLRPLSTNESAFDGRLNVIREENVGSEPQAGSDSPLGTQQHQVLDVTREDSGFSTEAPVGVETSGIQHFKKADSALSKARREESSYSSKSLQSTETDDSSSKAKSPGKKVKSPKGKPEIPLSKETKSSESSTKERSKTTLSSPAQNKLKKQWSWEDFDAGFKKAEKGGSAKFSTTDPGDRLSSSKKADKIGLTAIVSDLGLTIRMTQASSAVEGLKTPSYQVKGGGTSAVTWVTSGEWDIFIVDTIPSVQSLAQTPVESVRSSSATEVLCEETSRKLPLATVTDVEEQPSPLKRTKPEQLLPESAVDSGSQKALLPPAESTKTNLSEESEKDVGPASQSDDRSKDSSTPTESEDSRRSEKGN